MVEIYFYPGKNKVHKNLNSELCTAFEILALQKHDCFVCKPRNTLCIQKMKIHRAFDEFNPSFKTFCITNCMNRNLYLERKKWQNRKLLKPFA